MSTSEQDVCKAVAEMQDNILGAGIIEKLQLATMYAKPKVPLPREEEFRLMLAQSEVLVSIVRTNEDFFGRFRHIVISYGNSDVVLFPFPNNTAKIFVVQILRPYDAESIGEKVMQKLK